MIPWILEVLHPSEERSVDVVTQQVRELLGHGLDDVEGHGEIPVLLLPQPAKRVTGKHGNTPFVGRNIASSAMVDAADKSTERSLGHHRRHGFVLTRYALVIPQVAAGNDPRRAVLLRKIGQGSECAGARIALAGMGQRIQQIVPMERLGRCVWTDRRDRVGIELVAFAPRPQGQIHHFQGLIVHEEAADTPCLGEKRMQPFGVKIDEIALSTGLTSQVGIEARQHSVDSRVPNRGLSDHAAVSFEDRHQLVFAGGLVDGFDTSHGHRNLLHNLRCQVILYNAILIVLPAAATYPPTDAPPRTPPPHVTP
jgi:hypothetical protein